MCKAKNQIVLGSASSHVNVFGFIRKGILDMLENNGIIAVEYGNKRMSKSGSVIQSIKRITYHGQVLNVSACRVSELACLCECIASNMDIDACVESVETLYEYSVDKTEFRGGIDTIKNRDNITAFCNDVLNGNIQRLQAFCNRVILNGDNDSLVFEGMIFDRTTIMTSLKYMASNSKSACQYIKKVFAE